MSDTPDTRQYQVFIDEETTYALVQRSGGAMEQVRRLQVSARHVSPSVKERIREIWGLPTKDYAELKERKAALQSMLDEEPEEALESALEAESAETVQDKVTARLQSVSQALDAMGKLKPITMPEFLKGVAETIFIGIDEVEDFDRLNVQAVREALDDFTEKASGGSGPQADGSDAAAMLADALGGT